VLGDFTIRDELFVLGVSHLVGPTETNDLRTFQDYTLDGNLIAGNLKGNGENGHTLIDNLDASEVAATYKPVTQKSMGNYVIKAASSKTAFGPKRQVIGGDYALSGQRLVGDVFQSTGFFTQAASNSGAHPSILQLQWQSGDMPFISGFFIDGTDGVEDGGFFSRGYIDPGSLWVEAINGQARGYKAPIYGYTVEETQGNYLTKLNVFTPQEPSQTIAAFDQFMLYTPGCEYYDYVTAAGGASPTATVTASAEDLWIGFEDEVRVLNDSASSPAISLTQVLADSTSGTSVPYTGIAYILASRNNIDIESPPSFLARATPFRMPGETIVGEVVAESADGSTWTIDEVTSYRPGGKYDSAWIPISQSADTSSGRIVTNLDVVSASPDSMTGNRFYFNHNLGADLHFSDVNANLYLASYGAINSTGVHPNAYRSSVHSLWSADFRHSIGLTGAFSRVALSNATTASEDREASVFYMDGKVIGIQLHDDTLEAPRGQGTAFDHLRLIVKRTS
jgi:hypothetical protein